MLELYNFAPSTCSLKVRISLAEKGLEWIDHRLDSRNGDHLKPEYLKLNPNGVVPTLIHDGGVIIDSSVICEYLDEVFPAVSLTPTDPVRRAHMRKWLRFFEEMPTPAVRYPSFNAVLIRGFQKLSEDEFQAAANARPLRKHFYRRMGQDGFGAEEIEKAVDDIRTTVDRMEAALAGAGPWLMGEQYTLADICVVPSIDRMEDLGYEALWEERHPAVTAWLRRMMERPAVQTAFYKGARFSDIYPELGLGRSTPLPA
jgi:glutathione S-transferase